MAPVQDQIIRDINRWAKMRLEQWFIDAMSRYNMADIPNEEGYANITTILTGMAAQCLSPASYISPQEAGEVFAAMVTVARAAVARAEQMEKGKKNEQA
jgi:hypothetical protein